MIRKQLLAGFALVIVAGCSLVGLDNRSTPLVPSEIKQEGLHFRMRAEMMDSRWRLALSVENVSDSAITREFPGGCMVTDLLAYREGEWSEPVWRLWRIPGYGACTTDAIVIALDPGASARPDRWAVDLPVQLVLGDSLGTGSYRLGARDVNVDGGIGDPFLEMVAAKPVRLESCYDRPEPRAGAANQLPYPTEAQHGGLRFRSEGHLSDCGERWVLRVRGENVSDTTIAAHYPADCMITGLVAFREGEFDEPVWRAPEDSRAGLSCDETDEIGFLRKPGETVEPNEWRKSVRVENVLGDSLQAGYYRLGARTVSVDGEVGGVSAEMISPLAHWLE